MSRGFLVAAIVVLQIAGVRSGRSQISGEKFWSAASQRQHTEQMPRLGDGVFSSRQQSASTLDVAASECQEMFSDAQRHQTSGKYVEAYAKFQNYILSCYDKENVAIAFTMMEPSVRDMSTDPARWNTHRDWLKSVLYLKNDSFYYCPLVNAILGTMGTDQYRGYDVNGGLAVMKYLFESHKCDGMSDFWREKDVWGSMRKEQYALWKDTVTVDTSLFKLDTTLPSLEELGLEILRGPSAVQPPRRQQGVFAVRLESNPFDRELLVRFEEVGAAVQVEVFDVLGCRRYSKVLWNANEHSVDLSELPAGSYILRCESGGRVSSAKIFKR